MRFLIALSTIKTVVIHSIFTVFLYKEVFGLVPFHIFSFYIFKVILQKLVLNCLLGLVKFSLLSYNKHCFFVLEFRKIFLEFQKMFSIYLSRYFMDTL